ncbi:MAG: hypothetical protein Q8888_01660 [Vigna little leaf phytoplasma]|nr:hypothetical protein [Vigna little leaf phytoplasma]
MKIFNQQSKKFVFVGILFLFCMLYFNFINLFFIYSAVIPIDSSQLTSEDKIFYGDKDITEINKKENKKDLLEKLRQITKQPQISIEDFDIIILFEDKVDIPSLIKIQFNNKKYSGQIEDARYFKNISKKEHETSIKSEINPQNTATSNSLVNENLNKTQENNEEKAKNITDNQIEMLKEKTSIDWFFWLLVSTISLITSATILFLYKYHN